jgi:Flp pilus assembly protein CpaB
MSISIRRRISGWMILTLLVIFASGLLLIAALNKPLPTYLVAKRDLAAGESIEATDFVEVSLDLGPLAEKYLTTLSNDWQVLSHIPAGELVPLSRLGIDLAANQTVVRLMPSVRPAANVKPGSWVSVWQVIEQEDNHLAELLVQSAEVSAVEFGEGLFADKLPEVEVVLGAEQATLLITALAAKTKSLFCRCHERA